MPNFDVLEPAVDPNNRISFLIDWELTMKCNLDCSYCSTDLYGGHNNSINHPSLKKCLDAIDFMFSYANLYMTTKPKGIKYVILNVYGGESLYHPEIEQILKQVKSKYQQYKDLWHLTITTTTNAIVSQKKLEKLFPLIDEFTVSYHSESSDKQKQQFKKNLLSIAYAGKRQKCVVMMHESGPLFEDCMSMIEWLKKNDIKFLPKQLDGDIEHVKKRVYSQQQVIWFDSFYKTKIYKSNDQILQTQNEGNLTDIGRACCGGRQTCTNQDYKKRHFYVNNKFQDWYCSVNHFFLHIKQVTGEIFVNKDCKMNFENKIGPIGTLDDCHSVLTTLQLQLANKTMPIIQCKKNKCHCGLCAPKAKTLEKYKSIMEKYQLN